MENVINCNYIYLCRILYLIDILKMRSLTSRRKTLQYMSKNFKYLPTDIHYTLKPTMGSRKNACVPSLTCHACPLIRFSNIECWHQFPFPQIKKKRVPDFRFKEENA